VIARDSLEGAVYAQPFLTGGANDGYRQPVLVFAEFRGDAVDGFDVTDFGDVHGHDA